MRLTAAAALATFALSATTSLAQEYNQTGDFHLIISAPGSQWDGTTFEACHEGAAIEGLCAGATVNSSDSFQLFQFNYTDSQPINASAGLSGILTYELQGANFIESEPLVIFYNATSNVALPLFEPSESDAAQVAFDSNEHLNIQTEYGTPFYNWAVCTTDYAGYTYNTLSWIVGDGTVTADNPTCTKVEVYRKFV